MRLYEHEITDDEFTELLEEVSNGPLNAWENDFIKNMQSKYDSFGADMFLSHKQLNKLQSIQAEQNKEQEDNTPAVDEVMERQYNKGGNYYFDPFDHQ